MADDRAVALTNAVNRARTVWEGAAEGKPKDRAYQALTRAKASLRAHYAEPS